MKKNKRLAALLKYLVDQEEPVSIRALSEILTVSRRTIRYDLDEIEDFLNNTEFELKRKPNYGIFLEGANKKADELYNKFDNFYSSRHFRSAEKRQYIILYRLFQKKEPILIKELADFLELSNTTVSRDLNNVEKWLEKQDLELVRRRNYGVEISGDEMNIRRAMKALINQTYENGEMIDLLNEINEREGYSGRLEHGFSSQIENLIGEKRLKKLEKIIREAEKKLKLKFADAAYAALVFHIAFAVSRLKSNKDITIEEKRLLKLKEKEEYKISEQIAAILEEKFEIEIPEDEIGYITLHLLGARMREQDLNTEDKNLNKLEILVKQIIELVGDYFELDLSHDQKLFNGLLIHLKAALNRLLFNLGIENPLLDDIKSRYGDIFTAVEKAARMIQNEYYVEISEEEIAYLTIHFGAALERLNYPLKRTAEVVVVCSSGVGTTNLLEVRLKNEFKGINIVDSLSTFEVQDDTDKLDGIDFIISTIPFKFDKKDVITVKPFLDEDDIDKIKNYLKSKQIGYGIFSEKKKTPKNDRAGDITKLISPYISDEKKEEVNKLIKSYLQENNSAEENINNADNYHSDKGIFNFLAKDLIKVHNEKFSWKKALQLSGEILVEKDFIENRYVEKMIEIVEDKGPYIAVAPNICLAHAGLEDGVKKASISLAVFKDGFEIKHDFDPINFVFVLAPEDRKSHLPALTDIMKIANNQELLKKLLNSNSNTEIYQLIENFLKS